MSSQTGLVAGQVRLRQWAAQIQECQSRPADMKVETWCSEHGITKANYYYRLRRVRKACLEACNGAFSWPRSAEEALEISSEQYAMLMQGLEIIPKNPIRPNDNPQKLM